MINWTTSSRVPHPLSWGNQSQRKPHLRSHNFPDSPTKAVALLAGTKPNPNLNSKPEIKISQNTKSLTKTQGRRRKRNHRDTNPFILPFAVN